MIFKRECGGIVDKYKVISETVTHYYFQNLKTGKCFNVLKSVAEERYIRLD